jgi:glycosyltransferase involved in cell wall biosynthesis
MLGRHAKHVLFSPHNTFSRAGHRYEESMLRWACRRAGQVVAFSAADAEKLAGWGVSSFVCPLVLYVPPSAVDLVSDWRHRLSSGSPDPVVLVAGQIRTDKGIDDVLSAAAVLERPVTVAVLGEDKGGLFGSKRYAEQLGVRANWIVGYQDMADFAAAVSAADVVVTPYSRASQSGVLVLACQLGTPSITFPAGGLAEYATVTTERADRAALVDSLVDFFDGGRPGARAMPPVEDYLKELYAK